MGLQVIFIKSRINIQKLDLPPNFSLSRTAELGNYRANFTTFFIDCMAKIGWAYDLKTVSPDTIQKRIERTGDGSHPSPRGNKDDRDTEKNHAFNKHHVST